MAKATKEQIAWFQELWREIMGDPINADRAQSWFEKFPDKTKEETRKILELFNSPEFRADFEAWGREERRRERQAKLAAWRARGNPTGMYIMILTHKPVSNMYAANLALRGHSATFLGGGPILHDHASIAARNFVEEIEDSYDGCLLLGREPELLEIADIFEAKGKEVWRELADIPRDRDRSGA
jgi:hypothetical protein